MADWVLGIDTATPWLALALWRAVDGRTERHAELLGRDIAARLSGDLAAFMEHRGVTPGDLNAIAVGVGPGSYTGVRLGIAAALGLGRALGIPVHGGATLEALLAPHLSDGASGWALIDARRGRAYALRATRSGAALTSLHDAGVVARHELPEDGLPRWEGHAPDAAWHASWRARRDDAPPPAQARYQ